MNGTAAMKRSAAVLRLGIDWYYTAQLLLTAIFLYQYIAWFDTFWLSETRPIVEFSLLVTLLVEIIPRVHIALRRMIQLILIVAVHVQVLNVTPVQLTEGLSAPAQWVALFYGHFTQLTPFIWFGIGTWFIYLFMNWWITTRSRILFMIALSIISFAIIDSFSTFYMWTYVAWFVGSGLLLLVIRHMADIRKRLPDGWTAIREYPANTLLLVCSILGATIALGVLAPDIRPLVTDPYTLWKASKGEPIAALGKTRIIEIAGGAGTSGYSRSDTSLGGGFSFDYTPVFEVDASRRSYWRGETRSLYTGNGWEPSQEERRVPINTVAADKELPADGRRDMSKLETIEVTQKVTMLTDQSYPVLFGAHHIQKVGVPEGAAPIQFDRARWSPGQSSIRWIERGPTMYPKQYSVVSQVPIVDPAALRTAPMPASAAGLEDYLQLPADLPQRVRQFALEVTAGAGNPYDKVKALEQYLSMNYSYTNNPDVSKGRSRDFVERFLFEMKEGYCDYFSTSMVVLTRSLGLPARWVKGYAPGTAQTDLEEQGFLPEDLLAASDGPNVFTVRNSDAHSWMEVYFDGYGWLPFEATPGFVLPVVMVEAPMEEIVSEISPVLSDMSADQAEEQAVVYALGGGAIAVILAAAAVFVANRKLKWTERLLANRRRSAARAVDHSGRLVAEFERLIRYFRRKGLPRHEHETVRESIRRWTDQYRYLKADLDPLMELFERAKYSRSGISEQEYQLAESKIRKLREQVQ